MNPGLLFSGLPVLGVIVGALRVRYPRLPWIVAGVLLVVYLLYLVAFGTYAATCWDCTGDSSITRGDNFIVTTILLSLILLVTLASIALGARLTIVLGRLSRTMSELRRGGEERGPPVA